jgi:hypothetical protein
MLGFRVIGDYPSLQAAMDARDAAVTASIVDAIIPCPVHHAAPERMPEAIGRLMHMDVTLTPAEARAKYRNL